MLNNVTSSHDMLRRSCVLVRDTITNMKFLLYVALLLLYLICSFLPESWRRNILPDHSTSQLGLPCHRLFQVFIFFASLSISCCFFVLIVVTLVFIFIAATVGCVSVRSSMIFTGQISSLTLRGFLTPKNRSKIFISNGSKHAGW